MTRRFNEDIEDDAEDVEVELEASALGNGEYEPDDHQHVVITVSHAKLKIQQQQKMDDDTCKLHVYEQLIFVYEIFELASIQVKILGMSQYL